MPPISPPQPSLRDLLLLSDFGRAHPDRVEAALRPAQRAPSQRHSDDLPLPERVA